MAGKRSTSERGTGTYDSYRPGRSDYPDKRHNNMPSPSRDRSSTNTRPPSGPRTLFDERDLNSHHDESRDLESHGYSSPYAERRFSSHRSDGHTFPSPRQAQDPRLFSPHHQGLAPHENPPLSEQRAAGSLTAPPPPPPPPPPPSPPPPPPNDPGAGQADALLLCLAGFQDTIVDSTIAKTNLKMQEHFVESAQRAVDDIKTDNPNSRTKRTALENGKTKLRELQAKLLGEERKTTGYAKDFVDNLRAEVQKPRESQYLLKLSRIIEEQSTLIKQQNTDLERLKGEIQVVKQTAEESRKFETIAKADIQELRQKQDTASLPLSKAIDLFGSVQGQSGTISILRSDVNEARSDVEKWKTSIEEDIRPAIKAIQKQISTLEADTRSITSDQAADCTRIEVQAVKQDKILAQLREDLAELRTQGTSDHEALTTLQQAYDNSNVQQSEISVSAIDELRDTVQESTEKFGETDEFLRDQIDELRGDIDRLRQQQSTFSTTDKIVEGKLADLDGVLTAKLNQKADWSVTEEFDTRLKSVTAKVDSQRLPTPPELGFSEAITRVEALEKTIRFLQDRYYNLTTDDLVAAMAKHFDTHYGFGQYRNRLSQLEHHLQPLKTLEPRLKQLDVRSQLLGLQQGLSQVVAQCNPTAARFKHIDQLQIQVTQNSHAINDLNGLHSLVHDLQSGMKSLDENATDSTRTASRPQTDNDFMEATRETTSKLEAEYLRLSTSVVSHEAKFNGITRRMDNHESRLDRQDEAIVNFQAEKIQLHQKLNDLEKKAQAISKDYAVQKDVQDLRQALDSSAKATSEEMQSSKIGLIARLDGFVSTLSRSEKSTREALGGLDHRITQQHSGHQQSIDSMRARVDEIEPIVNQTPGAFQDLSTKFETLAMQDLESLPERLTQLQTQVMDINKRLQSQELFSEASSLSAEKFKALPEDLVKLQAQLESLDQDRQLQELSSKVQELAAFDVKALPDSFTQLQAQIEALDTKLQAQVDAVDRHLRAGTSHISVQDSGKLKNSRVSSRPSESSMKKPEAPTSVSSSKPSRSNTKRENTFPSTLYVQSPGSPKEAPRSKPKPENVITINDDDDDDPDGKTSSRSKRR